MDSEGNVLKEDTPFGWTLEKCTANEALTVLHGSAPSPDILAAMSVPCEGLIKDPRHCRKLKLRLKGVPFTQAELELSDRQKVIGGARTNLDLEVSTAVLPAAQLPPLPLPENIKRYLAATPSLQSGDPEMLKKAEAITKGKATAWDKSIALYDWVYNRVSKESTVSLPSALDVLHTLKGDCKEHTYLTVGLARAAGIPARIMVGVVYHEGAFYYHAWPSLYAGRWIEMDPTWGEETVDATHIALIEGELEQQLRLVKVLGQLRIQVLGEYDHD